MQGSILYAAPSAFPVKPLSVDEESGAVSDTTGLFPSRLPGFYLADTGGHGIFQENLPPLPAYTVKVLRLLVMEVSAAPEQWWKAVTWKVISEEWIKLA